MCGGARREFFEAPSSVATIDHLLRVAEETATPFLSADEEEDGGMEAEALTVAAEPGAGPGR